MTTLISEMKRRRRGLVAVPLPWENDKTIINILSLLGSRGFKSFIILFERVQSSIRTLAMAFNTFYRIKKREDDLWKVYSSPNDTMLKYGVIDPLDHPNQINFVVPPSPLSVLSPRPRNLAPNLHTYQSDDFFKVNIENLNRNTGAESLLYSGLQSPRHDTKIPLNSQNFNDQAEAPKNLCLAVCFVFICVQKEFEKVTPIDLCCCCHINPLFFIKIRNAFLLPLLSTFTKRFKKSISFSSLYWFFFQLESHEAAPQLVHINPYPLSEHLSQNFRQNNFMQLPFPLKHLFLSDFCLNLGLDFLLEIDEREVDWIRIWQYIFVSISYTP